MLCCGEQCILTGYSYVCTVCGSETRCFSPEVLPGYNRSHATMRSTTYSRRYRFHNLLLKTVLYHTGPPSTDPIWEYLEKERVELKTHKDIQRVLAKTPFKNKRYCCLPVFTKVFCPETLPKQAVSASQIQQAMGLFDSVERRWLKVGGRFFSYYFLLEVILTEVGAAFALSCAKRLICKHRRAFYFKMLKDLGGLTTGLVRGKAERGQKERESHLENAIHQPKIPRYARPRCGDRSGVWGARTSSGGSVLGHSRTHVGGRVYADLLRVAIGLPDSLLRYGRILNLSLKGV